MSPILKVSVLTSGSVLLDGEPVSVELLRKRVEVRKVERPVIWYYREGAAGEPPAEALQVLKIVTEHRLPISLCSKPDFSDYVDRKGVSHPRYATWESAVAKVRESTLGGKYVGVIRPDRTYLLIPSPRKGLVAKQLVEMMEKLVPRRPARNIAVIADTYFAWKDGGGVPSLEETGREIPFFGILMGLAYIGHAVYVFPGTGESLGAGCKGTDVLVVDGAQIASLAADWKDVAKGAMRGANIVMHDRATFKLTPVSP